MSVYFYFIFSHSNLFWFNFWYVAKLFYLKIEKSSNSANYSYKCCFGIDEIKNRPVVFTSTFLRKNPLTRQTRCTLKPLSCKLEWTNQKHFYCFFLKPVRDNLAPGFPRALDVSPLHAQKSSGSRLLPTKTNKLRLSCRKKENLKRWKVLEVSKFTYKLRNYRFQTAKGKSIRHH